MTDWRGAVLAGVLAALPVGCALTMPFDPVEDPPARFQRSATVAVAFTDPDAAGFACAGRGALFANACTGPIGAGSAATITIANPCPYRAEHWLLRQLCHELAHANGWPANHAAPPPLPPASDSPQAKALAASRRGG